MEETAIVDVDATDASEEAIDASIEGKKLLFDEETVTGHDVVN